ncbi:hypothetical protein Nepgr_000455 [Nepenthes gracilis]|uniref:Micronuclear linker histone polyprotein-like protein n=1 Tax=Nepenthes gracilis TaxID=150966 RepID=A0AAD3P338_NEPGR|nr:hypothetical protein Nepgr_000455 [Nepenthes gracilis]
MGSSLRSSSNGYHRGRPYAVMLLLAFGAALLGVVILHKFRECRVLSVLVNEKDQQLIALHTLLQREQEVHREAQKKLLKMKEKVYPLQAEKMEADRRLLEMQSIISSLRDKHKALESALDEKKNEIKILQERDINSNDEISQVAALRETLKQKEAEIEDLKRKLEKPVKVWSVSTDNPSNPHVDFTTMGSLEQTADDRELQEPPNSLNIIASKDRNQNETPTEKGSEQSTQGEAVKIDGVFLGENATTGEEASRKLEDGNEGTLKGEAAMNERSIDENQGSENEDSQGQRGSRVEENIPDAQKARDEHNNTQAVDGVNQSGKLESPQAYNVEKGQGFENFNRSSLDLERTDGSGNGSGSKVRRKHKGKRWRELGRKTRGKGGYSENKAAGGTGAKNFSDDALETKRYSPTGDKNLQKIDIIEDHGMETQRKYEPGAQDAHFTRSNRWGEEMGSSGQVRQNDKEEKPVTDKNADNSATIRLQETQKSENGEDHSNDGTAENKEHANAEQEMAAKLEEANVQGSTAADGREHNAKGDNRQKDDQKAHGNTDNRESFVVNKEEKNVSQVSDKEKQQEDPEDADTHESEMDEADDYIFMKSDLKFAAAQDEYKDEAEETEF